MPAVELGLLEYVNLVDGAVGPMSLEAIVALAREQNKLVFANFVEWPG